MATKRFRAAAREWGPVGACAGILCAVLVWLGITACGLAYPALGVALIGGGGGGGGDREVPVDLPTQFIGTTNGLLSVDLEFLAQPDGTFLPQCSAAGAALAGLNVLDVERVEFGTEPDEFLFLAIVQPPSSDEHPMLKRLAANGTETDSIDLPFQGSFDVDTQTWTVYVAEEDGDDIAVVDLGTGTVHLQERSGGLHVERAGDLRVVDGTTWVSNNMHGGIDISGQVALPGERIILEPGSQVSIDHVPSSGLIHAVTHGGLWEVDVATRHATRVRGLDGGTTVSSDEFGSVSFTALVEDSTFAVDLREPGELDAREVDRLEAGWHPVDQVTVDGHTFIALRDMASDTASKVACPFDVEAVVTFKVWGLSRTKTANTPPPPPPGDPELPEVTIDDAMVNEPAGTVSVAVSLSRPSTAVVAVDYAVGTGPGTARPVDDFVPASGTLFFEGVTTRTITIAVLNDDLNEIDENFSVDLSNPAGVTIRDAHANVTITSDDQQPRVAPIPGQVLVEGNATAPVVVPVTLDHINGVDTTVTFAAVNGTAIEGVHFIVQTPSVVIPAGAIGANLVLDVIGDTTDNPDRSFALMVGAINATVLSSVVNVTIADDDAVIPPGTIQVTVGTAPVDLAITVDGITATAPPPFFWDPNSTHELRARGIFNLADRRYRFSQWNDGDTTATRNVVVVAPAQFVALYNTDYRLTVNTTAGGTITIDPPSESGYYPAGQLVTVTAVPAPNFTAQFSGFDDLGGPNQAFVTMKSPRTVTVTFLQAPPPPPPP